MKPPREFFVPLEALLFKAIYPDFFIFILTQDDGPNTEMLHFNLGPSGLLARYPLIGCSLRSWLNPISIFTNREIEYEGSRKKFSKKQTGFAYVEKDESHGRGRFLKA
jgi:hypothetical protein